MVCLLNETSASDGDIFPAMFRRNKLGKLIGKRSWGGIIGITNRGTLMDGGTVNVPEFGNTEEWYQSIPEHMRPKRDQPFYHLLAENTQSYYTAYVSEQNLVEDSASGPVGHPDVGVMFGDMNDGRYTPKQVSA